MLSDGLNIESQYQIQVLNNKVAQMAVREAMLEAAVQQLLAQNQRLELTMNAMKEAADEGIVEQPEVKQEG
jgi:regulator of replication initiation timing